MGAAAAAAPARDGHEWPRCHPRTHFPASLSPDIWHTEPTLLQASSPRSSFLADFPPQLIIPAFHYSPHLLSSFLPSQTRVQVLCRVLWSEISAATAPPAQLLPSSQPAGRGARRKSLPCPDAYPGTAHLWTPETAASIDKTHTTPQSPCAEHTGGRTRRGTGQLLHLTETISVQFAFWQN